MSGTAPLLAVTVSGKAEPAVEAEAREWARSLGAPFLPRKGSLKGMLAHAQSLLVFSASSVTLVDAEGQLSFHAGMAHLRMQRLATGEGDTLARLAELRPGDTVLDCTLGLGQDALVAARAVGPGGRVVGVERSLPLYAVLSAGLHRAGAFPDSCKVEVHHADAHAFLEALPGGSFDVVLFDPMFEAARKSQPAFELLRRHADHTPLGPETLAEARRVARRRVLVKAARATRALTSHGLTPLTTSRYADLSWGVLDVRTP